MKSQSFFQWSVVLLVLTGMAKLLSITSQNEIMSFPDPLFGVSNRSVMSVAAGIELMVAVILVTDLHEPLKLLVMAWLGGSFLVYRFLMGIVKPGAPCKCLGSLTEQLHISEDIAARLLTTIALFFFLGGLWSFMRHIRLLRIGHGSPH